jgi:hypothetical protein
MNINIQLIASLTIKPKVKKSIYEDKQRFEIIEINYTSLDENLSEIEMGFFYDGNEQD